MEERSYEFHSRYNPYPDRLNATMTSSAIQMHLLGLLVPQLGQIFAKQATSSPHLRQVARQALWFDLAIMTSSSGLRGQILAGVDVPVGAVFIPCREAGGESPVS